LRSTLLLLLAAAGACAPRRSDAARTDLITVTIRVVNNLSEALDVSASQGGTDLWTGHAAPATSVRGQLGALVRGSLISVRARNAAGTVVVRRDSVAVSRAELVWVIP
jgi:hypothetical protein